jgi:hypothetical protein
MKARTVSPALVGALVVLFSMAFICLGGLGLYHDYQFQGRTGKSTATIESLSRSSTSGRGGGSTYMAVYSYSTPAGLGQTADVAISPSSYYRLHRGEQVAVKYLLDAPGESRLDDEIDEEWQWHNHETGLGVGLFFASMGLFLIYLGWRKKNAPG